MAVEFMTSNRRKVSPLLVSVILLCLFCGWQATQIALASGQILSLSKFTSIHTSSGGPYKAKPFRRRLKNKAKYLEELKMFKSFADRHQCNVKSPLYSSIFDQFQPFEKHGISDKKLMTGFTDCYDSILVEVKDKQVTITPKPVMIGEGLARMQWYYMFFEQLAPYLPDTKAVINLMDEPCSWTSPIPKEAEQAIKTGGVSAFQAAFLKYGCDGVGMSNLKDYHGFLVSPSTFPATRIKTPVWSWYSIPGCFADILGPNHGAWDFSPPCPPPYALPFKEKKQVAVFRGSTSGGWVGKNQTAAHYSKFHRQRLSELSKKLNRPDIDAGIVGYVQCEPEKCQEQQDRYGVVPHMGEDQIMNHAYHILVDGNGALLRLARYMCSVSVPILGTVMKEWFHMGLRPWKEYLPLDISYNNLVELVEWAKGHPNEAEEVAKNAAKYVERNVRHEDQLCYVFKLVVEQNRLMEK